MKIQELEIEQPDGSTVTYIIIDRGNDEFTSMTKAHYEELKAQREQSGTL